MFDKLNLAYKNYSQEIELAAQQVLVYSFWFSFILPPTVILTAEGLAHSVKCLSLQWEDLDSNPGAGGTTQGLKQLRSEGTAFALQMAKPSCGLDTHIEWLSFLQKET